MFFLCGFFLSTKSPKETTRLILRTKLLFFFVKLFSCLCYKNESQISKNVTRDTKIKKKHTETCEGHCVSSFYKIYINLQHCFQTFHKTSNALGNKGLCIDKPEKDPDFIICNQYPCRTMCQWNSLLLFDN